MFILRYKAVCFWDIWITIVIPKHIINRKDNHASVTISSLYNDVMSKYGEAVKYVFYGGITTLISWGTYALFVWAGIMPFWSNILSWICGVTFAFFANKFRVFESTSTDKKVLAYESSSFIIARIFTGVLAAVLFPILYDLGLNQSILGTDGLPAKIAVSIIEIIINWVLSKYIIFKKTPETKE